jgi:hypothetical protein
MVDAPVLCFMYDKLISRNKSLHSILSLSVMPPSHC